MRTTFILIAACAAVFGCSSSRNVVTVQDSTSITKGRELSDLQRALSAGAISPEEYETLRKKVLRRPN